MGVTRRPGSLSLSLIQIPSRIETHWLTSLPAKAQIFVIQSPILHWFSRQNILIFRHPQAFDGHSILWIKSPNWPPENPSFLVTSWMFAGSHPTTSLLTSWCPHSYVCWFTTLDIGIVNPKHWSYVHQFCKHKSWINPMKSPFPIVFLGFLWNPASGPSRPPAAAAVVTQEFHDVCIR